MNVADAAAVARRLESLGYQEAPNPEDADLILLETCCVREKPEHKVYSRLGELRPLKRTRPGMILGVCGCMAQKEGRALLERVPYVDLVVGPRGLLRLPEMLAALEAGEGAQVELSQDGPIEDSGERDYTRYAREGAVSAFVNIIEGCDYRCSYCVVPSVRGPFTSRQPKAVVEEVRRLVEAGIKEVTLLGQSVLAYGRDQGRAFDIVGLWELLTAIEGLKRIRFTTNHPLEVSERIISAVADIPKVMEHFHMPIQAGEDRLLRAMRRGYTVARYEDLLGRIRARIPGVSVTSDCIVGFPGETDEMFETSLETYRRLRLDQQFMFVYSSRPGTPAAALGEQVPHEIKAARMARLVELQNHIALGRNAEAAGSVFEIMVEGWSPRDETRLTGRTRHDKTVVWPPTERRPPAKGSVMQVHTTVAHMWGFEGELVG